MRIIPKSVADVYSVYADYQFVHIFRNADASKPNDKVSWQLFISRKFFIKFLCWTIRIKPKVNQLLLVLPLMLRQWLKLKNP